VVSCSSRGSWVVGNAYSYCLSHVQIETEERDIKFLLTSEKDFRQKKLYRNHAQWCPVHPPPRVQKVGGLEIRVDDIK
jgi:hypothetical protein